ncbi:MAG: hypothetical protein QNJ40_18235 [Xanthomonadales bacterium]|nr:hypothetical protein [Xanthomonadales bacterium]
MKVFDIYRHPRYGHAAVARGFSWPAFLAPSVWSATCGLGSVTLYLVAWSTLMFELMQLTGGLVDHPALRSLLLLMLVAGFGIQPGRRASHWHAGRLKSQEFRWNCTVAASSARRALKMARSGKADGVVPLDDAG